MNPSSEHAMNTETAGLRDEDCCWKEMREEDDLTVEIVAAAWDSLPVDGCMFREQDSGPKKRKRAGTGHAHEFQPADNSGEVQMLKEAHR